MRNPILITLTVLALAGCAREAGHSRVPDVFGEAKDANLVKQVAYPDPAIRLRDLSIAFAAEARDTVNFDFNKTALDAEARKALDGQAAWLKRNKEVRMTVTGHTDLVGGELYNDRLGLRRAQAVVAYLARRGVKADRLDAVESRGEAEPVVQTPDRERRNRRTVTAVAGFDRNYAGFGQDGELARLVFKDYQTTVRRDLSSASSTDATSN